MTSYLLELAAMLIIILVAAELFTNALEHLGERLGISEGVTGSLFAALGTALPETLVPLLALCAGTANVSVNEEIGVGAILGAPLMLSTLSTCLMAASVLFRRGAGGLVQPERGGFLRDLHFFLFAFIVAAVAMYAPLDDGYWRPGLSLTLVMTYVVYIALTLRASKQLVEDGNATEADDPMFLSRIGLPTNMLTINVQLLLGLGLLVFGAEGFIDGIQGVAEIFGVSALLLSLLIIPIATELPEKVNSIIWVRRGRDTLAFSNITGAMVFQGTLLPAIGILLTPWQPRIEVLSGVLITLFAAFWLRLNAGRQGLKVWALLINGLFYFGYLYLTL